MKPNRSLAPLSSLLLLLLPQDARGFSVGAAVRRSTAGARGGARPVMQQLQEETPVNKRDQRRRIMSEDKYKRGGALRQGHSQGCHRENDGKVQVGAARGAQGVELPRGDARRGQRRGPLCARQGVRLLLGRRALDRARVGGA